MQNHYSVFHKKLKSEVTKMERKKNSGNNSKVKKGSDRNQKDKG